MAQIELLLPKMGESVAEATVIKWLVNEGDTIEADQAVIEIATDKVDSEVPAPDGGVITKLLFKEGDVIQVGQPIAIIETSASASAKAPADKSAAAVASSAPAAVAEAPKAAAQVTSIDSASPAAASAEAGDKFLSPLVKSIAKTEGLTGAEIDAIQGTGANGRITKDDVLSYLSNGRKAASTSAQATSDAGQTTPATTKSTASAAEASAKVAPTISVSGADELVEMDRMRKLIADHMIMSKKVSPHVSSFVEADVTNVVLWRNKVKDKFEKAYGEKLTFTPIFLEAVAKVIREMPQINCSVVDDNKILYKKNINIGMAAALPSGNLIVPVIKNADQLNLAGLTRSVNDLANRARKGALKPDEIQGGTYTVSNVGTFGNVFGTPIINQPQVAILALGAIKKKPAVIETPTGDVIGIRHFMFLSHSYDHRVVDGALGGTFIKRVSEYLENWDINREI